LPNVKPLYGGSKGTKAQERWYKEFRERYPDLNKVQEAWVSEVLGTKQLITPWGLRYYWPRATINNYGYVNVKSSVYNYPIQALATAEIIPVALVCLRNRLSVAGLEDVLLVNTVHDSVCMEVKNDPKLLDILLNICIMAFGMDVYQYLKDVYRMDFNVPLGVSIKIGEHWGEGEETSYTLFRDGRAEKI
jgi:DNA polymerase I-like protein with 3'-5' exonuclease and polymerase domains